MASFTLYQPYDLTAAAKDWTPPADVKDVKKLSFTSGNLRLDLYASPAGTISYQDGKIVGAVSELSLFNASGEIYRIGKDANDPSLIFNLAPDKPLSQWALPYDMMHGNDLIAGSSGNDILYGYEGDDIFLASAGSDRIDGGAGFDHVRFSGNLGDYTVVRTGSGFSVTNLVDGSIDTVNNIERLDFADKFIAADVGVDTPAGQVVRLYQAAFDRLPDADGLLFWATKAANGVSLEAMAQGFIDSKEYQQLYPPILSNRALVAEYYQNILHRSPDPKGLTFWTDVLESGAATDAQVLVGISESVENVAGTATLIGNGLVLDYALMT